MLLRLASACFNGDRFVDQLFRLVVGERLAAEIGGVALQKADNPSIDLMQFFLIFVITGQNPFASESVNSMFAATTSFLSALIFRAGSACCPPACPAPNSALRKPHNMIAIATPSSFLHEIDSHGLSPLGFGCQVSGVSAET